MNLFLESKCQWMAIDWVYTPPIRTHILVDLGVWTNKRRKK